MKQPHMTKADLDKLIASIAQRGRKMDSDIQDAGVCALQHLRAHGDIGPINRLYVALPKGARRSALASWALAYGALKANTDKETHSTQPFVFDRTKRTDPEAAEEDCWFNHRSEASPVQVFDLQKALESLIKRASGKELVHGELLTGVQGLLLMVQHPTDQNPAGDAPRADKAPS